MSDITDIRPVLVVTGAAFEARIAAGAGIFVICSGGDASKLRKQLDECESDGFRAAISFGLAGGLDPALRPGDLIIADEIISGTTTWRTSPDLMQTVQQTLQAGGVKTLCVRLAGADATMMTPASKSALRAASAASAVDMESHIVAAFAARGNLPWGTLRAICDPACRELPKLAAHALKPDGRIDFMATFKSLVREPLQVPALIRTGLDTAIAVVALRRTRRILDFAFGLGRANFR